MLTLRGGSISKLALGIGKRSGGVTGQVNHIIARVVGASTRYVQILCLVERER